MTKIFHDWEFYEDGHMIRPISVGMVSSEGGSYYAIFEDAGYWSHKSKWLKDNVYPHIEHELVTKVSAVKSKQEIREDILNFLRNEKCEELWAWYGAYDHVSLAQMFGAMINMPEDIPWHTNDIKTLELLAKQGLSYDDKLGLKGREPKQNPATEHHAFYDATHDRDLYKYYMGILDG